MTSSILENLDAATAYEVQRVVTDLSWLERCTCSQFPLSEFFVTAGRAIAEDVREAALDCPARREEVIFAYARDIRWGYFGALSPGQRARMTLPEALELVDRESRDRAQRPHGRRRTRGSASPTPSRPPTPDSATSR